MRTNDIRVLRKRAQDLGIKYVTSFKKEELEGLIYAREDPQKLVEYVFNQVPHPVTITVPRGATKINLTIQYHD